MQNTDALPLTRFRQPRHALKPHACALEAAEQWALERAAKLSGDLFRLPSFWYIDLIIQHVPGERKTRYTGRLAQSENYGISFGLASALPANHEALARSMTPITLSSARIAGRYSKTDDIALTWIRQP
jgi:hypothetical protein